MNRTSIRLNVCGLVAGCLIGALGLSTALSKANPPAAPPNAEGPGLISRVEKLEARVEELRTLHQNVRGNTLSGLWYQNGDKNVPTGLFQVHDNNVILFNSVSQIGIGRFTDLDTIEVVWQQTGEVEKLTIDRDGMTIHGRVRTWTRKAGP
jgi:hypothetical protein